MQEVRALADVPCVPALAVIINCGTKWVTSLALASTLRHTDYPVLVIDCESTDGSAEHFRRLAAERQWSFRWLSWPLRPHGAALDLLFDGARAESILLVDSDLELLSGAPVRAMASALRENPTAYGAGFVQRGQWLGAAHGLPPRAGWYEERMWIPLAHLDTGKVRRVLEAGATFRQGRVFVEWPGRPTLSHLVGMRFWLPGFRTRGRLESSSSDPDEARASAAFIEYDTGARLHRRLRDSGYDYAEIDEALWSHASHFHGVTRGQLQTPIRRVLRTLRVLSARNAMATGEAARAARARLAEGYGIDLSNGFG